MTDINDFTDYTEGCHCGHSRHKHHSFGCSGVRREIDLARLPTAEYDDPENPFEWPRNWPAADEVPEIEKPCTCKGFGPADPEPPEEY